MALLLGTSRESVFILDSILMMFDFLPSNPIRFERVTRGGGLYKYRGDLGNAFIEYVQIMTFLQFLKTHCYTMYITGVYRGGLERLRRWIKKKPLNLHHFDIKKPTFNQLGSFFIAHIKPHELPSLSPSFKLVKVFNSLTLSLAPSPLAISTYPTPLYA